MAEQVRRADSTEGDIDTLSHRIAQIRTWTFVSNRPGWLADPAHWQEKTREIEDRLSDALHERLTKRFVDRRTSVLMRRLRENTMSEAEISPAGAVLVEGHHVGELQGFRFTADQCGRRRGRQGRARPPRRRRWPPSSRRAPTASRPAANGDIALGSDGTLRWIGAPIGTLVAGDDAVAAARRAACRRATHRPGARQGRGARRALRQLPDRYAAEAAGRPQGRRTRSPASARGIAFQLVENFGIAQPPRHRRGHQVARPGGPRGAAPARRPLRRLPYLRAGAAQAGPGRAGRRCCGR